MMLCTRLGCLVVAVGSLALGEGGDTQGGLPLAGEAAERFLLSAEEVNREPLPIGITESERLTLTLGAVRARAIWKTIDEWEPVRTFEDGSRDVGFQDSYKCEVAAYELDKLLGLGMVPPTVERVIDGEKGSLQLWVEGAMMEAERMERNRVAPDRRRWLEQIHEVRVFHNLIYNTDANNAGNILIGPDWRIHLIDHSRSFRRSGKLRSKKGLTRFSRSLLERLRQLDREVLEVKLGGWLHKRQIVAVLERRDRILKLAARLVAERGEEAVLYP